MKLDKGTTKRIADWFEKMSVAAMAVGLFQGIVLGFIVGILCLFISIYATKKIKELK